MEKDKEIIIHCETEKEWDKVQKKAFDRGSSWSGEKEIFNVWKEEKGKTCIMIKNQNMSYCDREYFEADKEYSHIKIIKAKEYLNDRYIEGYITKNE